MQTKIKIETFENIKKCEMYLNAFYKTNTVLKRELIPLIKNKKPIFIIIIEYR